MTSIKKTASLLIISTLTINSSFAQWSEDANNIWGTAGGKSVGIGTATPKSKLDVRGTITAGDNPSTNGSTILQGLYGSGALNNLGGVYSSGGTYLSYGANQNGSNTWLSTSSIPITRSIAVLDEAFRIYTAPAQTVPIGSTLTAQPKEIFTIANNGRIGMGTTTPLAKLHLEEDVSTVLRLSSSNNPSAYYTEIINSWNSNDAFKIQHNGASILRSSGTAYRLIEIGNRDNQNINLFTNSSGKVTVPNGNVGIGTSDPDLTSHIIGASGFPATSGINQVGVLRLQGTGSNGVLDFSVNAGSGATLQVTNRINLAANYSLILNPNGGNVGVGTTAPTEKLSVNGNIKAKKLIVTQTGWADYVFDKNYTLIPVDSLSTYIKTHKHLPEMPTTKDVQDHGVDVGNNQALLLKKIEELTLYIIEQHKEIEALKKKIK